jgi:phosphatidylserine decarboxylase
METLLFKESPLLFVVVTVFFGLIEIFLKKKKLYIFVVYTIFLLFLMYFYRFPVRENKYPSNIMVSPCDGKVVHIQKINSVTTHIAVFLNIFDCHVQWCPISGIVQSVKHKEGRFHPAYMLQKSKYNERTESIIFLPQINDEIKIVQIAGQVARRIVTDVTQKERVRRGDRYGMIKLGSRVDLFIPHDKIKLLINIGDRLLGNKTVLGIILS